MLRIPAESEKGGQDRLLPMAPEFADFLAAVPERERVGRVFKLVVVQGSDAKMQADWVSRVVCRIGRKARVVVDQRERRLVVDDRRLKAKPKPERNAKAKEKDDGIKRKYASAHDLRRAFGLRWAARVMPQILMQLMRHEDISTTMKFYVGKLLLTCFPTINAVGALAVHVPAAAGVDYPQPLIGTSSRVHKWVNRIAQKLQSQMS
jgi:hypothetical protein